MIFSYGFLESELTDARQLFLDLDIPGDDPLKPAKKAFCKDAPGVRLFVPPESERTDWESGFVWWACVNEEDGLDFCVLQTTEGQQELKATWKEKEVSPSNSLRDVISKDPLWDVFQLRAVVFLLERLEIQFVMLQESNEYVSKINHDEIGANTGIRSDIYATIEELRKLETELLERGIQDLSKAVCRTHSFAWRWIPSIHSLSTETNLVLCIQRDDLLSSETVTAYFRRLAEGPEEEDFS